MFYTIVNKDGITYRYLIYISTMVNMLIKFSLKGKKTKNIMYLRLKCRSIHIYYHILFNVETSLKVRELHAICQCRNTWTSFWASICTLPSVHLHIAIFWSIISVTSFDIYRNMKIVLSGYNSKRGVLYSTQWHMTLQHYEV